jgi:hypothetical protein
MNAKAQRLLGLFCPSARIRGRCPGYFTVSLLFTIQGKILPKW